MNKDQQTPIPNVSNPFDVEDQYQTYLKRVALIEENMGDVQRIETRRAFFGAYGQALLCMRDDVSTLDDDDAINALFNMVNQVSDFWERETNATLKGH